jgi:probable rRNA maturation factor
MLDLSIQNASLAADVPSDEHFRAWALAALCGRRERAQLSIRVVDERECATLNERFRGRAGATNVLSFPFDGLPGLENCELLGDVVICAPLVRCEAAEQGKALSAHWAHMVVHGVLHLLGFDHLEPGQAAHMEALESGILCGLGFPEPYDN